MHTENRNRSDVAKSGSLPEIPVALDLLRGVRWQLAALCAVAAALSFGLGWIIR